MSSILVLGVGLQGRAVAHDLALQPQIETIVAADLDPVRAAASLSPQARERVKMAWVDADDDGVLAALLAEHRPDAVICMLPPAMGPAAGRAALQAGAHYVSTSYTGPLRALEPLARERGLAVLPEMGMDPGIDLVLAQHAVAQLDVVHGLEVFGGGLPEAAHADATPLRYKITWTPAGVLAAYVRPARLLRGGEEVDLPGTEIFHPDQVRSEHIPGIGALEVYPNGDAVGFIETFGLGPELREMGRYSLRWPGHCALWYPLVQLGLLGDDPVDLGDGVTRTPRELLAMQLEPSLQFADDERDVIVLRVRAWGLRDGEPRATVADVVDHRDLETGLFAMNRTVGYTASIGAQLILDGTISARGLLSPARDVPPAPFFDALRERDIRVEHRQEDPR